jgi:hypothetical protein
MWWWSVVAVASEGGFDVRHAAFGAFLDGAVAGLVVDYDRLGARRAMLDGYLQDLSTAPVAALGRNDALALWVNAYNACTLRVVLDNRPLTSIRDLDGGKPWSVPRCAVGGALLSLDHIENQEIRPRGDGRVHAVVNCASKGCPPLPPVPLVGADLESQLDSAARRWVATNAVDRSGGGLRLSEVFRWYAADFARWAGAVPLADATAAAGLRFVAAYGDAETASAATAGVVAPTWATYDWALNGR